ncbi:MAG: glycosyltransferase family 9 protein [Candidatus Calescibacterium sp.]|nr:hypothetical protein [Candidatus Calescibacterium sp.]MCX7971976.1 hypothetical protein [bacterium]MDW8195438.1 glycosyltransferase family 9 protein [Candidatus Calescibacterium sp.]
MKQIGIVRLDRIGDTILTLPAIKLIKQKYPDCKIVGFFNQYNSQLFLYNSEIIYPYLDVIEILQINLNYQDIEKFSPLKNIFEYLKIIFWKKRKRYSFEKIFVFSPTTSSYLLGSSLKAQKKYTYFYQSRLNRFIFSNKYSYYLDDIDKSSISDYKNVRHEIFQNLEVLRLDFYFDFEDLSNYRPEIFLPDIPFEKYDLLVFDKKLWFYNPQGIRWLKIFINTIFNKAKNFNKNIKVGFISNRKEITDIAINPSITELLGLVKNCRCVVCFDSGIVHIASAFNTNIVAIFANRYFEFDTRRWSPLSDNKKIVKLDIFADDNFDSIDFEITNPAEFAEYVFYQATEYLQT